MKKTPFLLWLAYLFLWGCSEKKIDFNAEIRPILNNKCISCHGGVKQSGGFGLVFRENALVKTANDNYGIVPGNASKSEMIRRIKHHDPEVRMPLDADPLSASEIELLETWIDQGAKWEDHWAYKIPEEPKIPDNEVEWGSNGIDQFTLNKMIENGLRPSPEEEKVNLIRRISLDLIGLPPTNEQVLQFVESTSPNAYENMVDELLSSSGFGEHWATMWLDLARYADSRGYEKDAFRDIWKYRDWVIKAFNDDKPFTEFTIEQLAGDLLPDPTYDQLVATGFHRNTLNNDEGGTDNEEYRVAEVIDRVNTTWEVWQATTMGCVQCHSHPYDPIKNKEFYQSMAFFNNTADWDVSSEYPKLKELKEADQEKLEQVKGWIEEYGNKAKASYFEELVLSETPRINHEDFDSTVNVQHHNRADQDYMELYDGSRISVKGIDLSDIGAIQFYYRLVSGKGAINILVDNESIGGDQLIQTGGWGLKKIYLPIEHRNGVFDLTFEFEGNDAFDARTDGFLLVNRIPGDHVSGYQEIAEQAKSLLFSEPKVTTLIMREKPSAYQRDTHVFHRGSFLDPTEKVYPTVPQVLSDDSSRFNDRLDFARWLVSEENPLTARVMVNRIWTQLFGTGIVETVEDFGTIGDKPTHPELLDWLALRFSNEYQWSMKKLIKTIVMSKTYRQSSRVPEKSKRLDPKNTWLTHHPRVRLSAEQIRDQALAVTGLLSDKMYGPGVMPYQPPGIWNVIYSGQKWETSEGEDAYRRGIYTFIRRSGSYPSFITFDGSSREVCVSRRINTNTPLQALVTMNDPVYVEAAKYLANQVARQKTGMSKSIANTYEKVMLRPIGEEKQKLLEELYTEMAAYYGKNKSEMSDLIGRDDPHLAALTVVTNTLMNMDEFIVKS